MIFFLLASCTQQANAQNRLRRLLPPNTVMYYEVDNPAVMLASASAMMQTLGLSMFLDGMSLQDIISIQLSQQGLQWDDLNWDEPWGVAVFNTQKPDPDVAIFLPEPRNPQAVNRFFSQSGQSFESFTRSDYLIISNTQWRGSSERFINARSSLRTNDRQSLFIDLPALLENDSAMMNQLSEAESQIMLDFLDGMGMMNVSLSLENGDLLIQYGMEFTPGSNLDRLYSAIIPQGRISDYAQLLPAEALFSFITTGKLSNRDAAWVKEYYLEMLQLADFFPSQFISFIERLMDAGIAAENTAALASIDLNIPDVNNPQTITIPSLFIFDYENESAMNESLRLLSELPNQIEELGDLFRILYATNRSTQGVQHDQLSLEFTTEDWAAKTGSPLSPEDRIIVSELIEPALNFALIQNRGRTFAGNDHLGIQALESASRGRLATSLADTAAFQSLDLDRHTSVYANLSLKRLSVIIDNIIQGQGQMVLRGNVSGLHIFGGFHDHRMNTSILLPRADAQAITQKVISYMFMGNSMGR